jgi:hypothetical protein
MQPVKQGGFSTKHVYMLTPEAFFRALQRAQKHSKHAVDPTIYADYFQFIQKAFLHYSEFQLRSERLRVKNLTTENTSLTNEVKTLNAKMDKQTSMIKDQSGQIDKLLRYGQDANQKLDDTKEKLTEMNGKLDTMFEFLKDFAKMTLPMWVGSSVVKTQYQNLLDIMRRML